MQYKIGYQGIEGSNSLEAAKVMCKKLNLDAKYIPMVTSQGVVEALLEGKVHYGVLAIKNLTAGTVVETEHALKKINYKIIAQVHLPIHHCLFTKTEEVSKNKIVSVASHIQALLQCEKHLKALMPHVQKMEIKDTALGAKYLAEGRLTVETAIVCSKIAGEAYGLYLVEENIEDLKANTTEFVMLLVDEN